jgi:hypothetical protein
MPTCKIWNEKVKEKKLTHKHVSTIHANMQLMKYKIERKNK